MAMPMADPSMPGMMNAALPKNEMDYRRAIAPVAMLSLETSRLAVNKAVDPAVRQFASFELAEAIAATSVLRDMNTPMMPMSAMDREAISRAQNTPAGADFDRDYIARQRAAHIFLRDTATNYLATPLPRKAKMPEMHGRHLATLQMPAFIEHLTHTQNILGRLTVRSHPCSQKRQRTTFAAVLSFAECLTISCATCP